MNFVIFVCVSVTLKLFYLAFVPLLAPFPGDATECMSVKCTMRRDLMRPAQCTNCPTTASNEVHQSSHCLGYVSRCRGSVIDRRSRRDWNYYSTPMVTTANWVHSPLPPWISGLVRIISARWRSLNLDMTSRLLTSGPVSFIWITRPALYPTTRLHTTTTTPPGTLTTQSWTCTARVGSVLLQWSSQEIATGGCVSSFSPSHSFPFPSPSPPSA